MNKLRAAIPPKLLWRYIDDAGFASTLQSMAAQDGRTGRINIEFWTYLATQLEAYVALSLLRTFELFKAAIRSLNAHEIVPPAILARSCLELAASVHATARKAADTVACLKDCPPTTVAGAPELEKVIVTAIWGSRVGPWSDDCAKGNVLSIIQKLSKLREAAELLPRYEQLCELAHPNFAGYSRFVDSGRTDADGTRHVTIDARANADGLLATGTSRDMGSAVSEPRLLVVWSLSWTAFALLNAVALSQQAVRDIQAFLRTQVAPHV